ncbi:hypothetical protein H0H92_015954 [Tricholoma furcatifolium]|nr:hypothetical protein H0H92_015954 [Tricholoma furcatifolium]
MVSTNGIDGHKVNGQTDGGKYDGVYVADKAYELPSFSVDEARPMKVVAIGAGYTGITAGIRFRQRVKNVDLTIYESNSGVGGAWHVNRYPGLACDIPSHGYQLTFEDNKSWSAFYAPGPEIRAYLNRVVDKYALRPFVKLRHRITRAAYDEGAGKWRLTVRRPAPGSPTEAGEGVQWDWRTDYEEFEDTADVVLAGLGGLSRWAWPDVKGLESFEGRVIHSAQWDRDVAGKQGWEETVKDWKDKRVGIIGVGSSAIQIVPALQSHVKHLTNYVRGKTWISATFVRERLEQLSKGKPVINYRFTDEDKKNFEDPEYYKDFRWQLECEMNAANPATLRGSEMSIGGRKAFREDMLKKLAKKPWIADHLIPDFAPACRRLTPGPGYLEALCEDNILTARVRTGFDTTFRYDFPILGRNGVDLSDKFEPTPRTYLAVATDGFPNWFQCLGPSSGVGAGSLLLVMERQVDYVVAATLKMQRERLKSIEVKAEAVEDFDQYLESYFPSTVYSEKCRSWYKGGKDVGRVSALWPGSTLHAARALEHPRWEDYNYEVLDGPVKNRFYWLGDGQTVDDKDPNGDKAWYLKEIDYPPVVNLKVALTHGVARSGSPAMAPNFLSKLVNKATPGHSRDRSDSSVSRPRSRAPSFSSPKSRSRSPSPQPAMSNLVVPTFTTTNVDDDEESGAESDGTFPSVTVVPPSPLLEPHDLSRSNSETSLTSPVNHRTDGHTPSDTNSNMINGSGRRYRTTSYSASRTTLDPADDELSTPTTPRPRTNSKSSTKSAKSQKQKSPTSPVSPDMPSKTLEVRKQGSNRSLNRPPPVTIEHARAATTPAPAPASSTEGQDAILSSPQTSLVESPTSMQLPDYPSPPQSMSQSPSPPQASTSPSGSSIYLASPRKDTDNISLVSANGTSKEKKRPWSRSSRKPTGLASAIAASGLAMANPTLAAAQQAQLQAAAAAAAAAQQQQQSPVTATRKLSSASGRAPSFISASVSKRHHKKSKSNDLSPSNRSVRSRRAASVSVNGDDRSEYYAGEDHAEYYSGLEDSSSDEEDDSDDNLDDIDLGEDDMPVTGFAVASNKRNADFHELFSNIPEGDYLIDDYGCALQREILIQGRLYISENHICFHANIFGWITDLSIPIGDITHLEKKMTAFVIPNGIQITTRQNKYTFASFLSRDTTYDVIHNIWKLERPDDAASISSRRTTDDTQSMHAALADGNGAPVRKATTCSCGKEGKHFSETALEAVLPGTPEKIYSLIFASGFMKDFMAVNQKLMDIQISDWAPTAPGSKLLTRNMSYIKPLNAGLGPKQTKCEIRDEMLNCDFDDYVVMLTTTRTPDVPSGGVFAVKTRTCIMWAGPVSTRIVVSTEVEWSGRSFIKGIIERSAIDGQKVYHADLEKAMRAYIKEHQAEFVPEGVDLTSLSAAAAAAGAKAAGAEKEGGKEAGAEKLTEEEERKKREKERNQRGLQWAYDTFDGAYQVAKQSTRTAIELVEDAWEQSSSTTILWFVIVLLVFSNIYTLMRSGIREGGVTRKSLRKEEEREKLVQGVVTALWDEFGVAKAQQQPHLPPALPHLSPALPPVSTSWRVEVAQLLETLDAMEERIKTLKHGLESMEKLD